VIVLAAMILVYGSCCFGSMKKVAYLYFAMAIINAAIYPIFYALDTTEDSPWLFVIYGYGVTESYLKLLFLLWITRFKHRQLIILLFGHIMNDAFNSFHYGLVNDAIIVCEMICFIKGSEGVLAGLTDKLSPRNLRGLHHTRGHS